MPSLAQPEGSQASFGSLPLEGTLQPPFPSHVPSFVHPDAAQVLCRSDPAEANAQTPRLPALLQTWHPVQDELQQ